jgi:Ca2+/H+ antiporter
MILAGSGTNVVRGLGLASLLLGPVVIVLDRLDVVDELTLFVLAAAALIPISWLIGEATDNLARYTGPGIGGFLNATFGNAPELIIAIVAIADGLTDIVRASLVGSIAGNLLLVLGFTLLFGQRGRSIGCLPMYHLVSSHSQASSSSWPRRRVSTAILTGDRSQCSRFHSPFCS